MGFILWFSLGFILGCPGEDEPDPPEVFDEIDWSDDAFEFDVQWSDQATVIGEDQMSVVLEADTEEHVYRFNAAGVNEAGIPLAAGRILVIHGTALRLIEDVEESEGQLILSTDDAALTDAIDQGVIEWDYGVELSSDYVQALTPDGQPVAMQQGDTVEFEEEVDGYTLVFELALQGDHATFDARAEREGVAFVASGTIMRFRSRDRIVIEEGELQEYDNRFEHVRADLELEYEVDEAGQDFVDFTFPAPLLEHRFLVGYLPVQVDLDLQFIINRLLSSGGRSQVGGSFVFDSDLGFLVRQGEVEGDGGLDAVEMESETFGSGGASPIAIEFGFGFPRMGLQLFDYPVVPWTQVTSMVGGTFDVFPPCETADQQLSGSGAIDLSLFGLQEELEDSTFFGVDEVLLRSGGCPDDSSAPFSLTPR